MILKGIQKTTLLDFPTKVACTVFTAGCNFRCPFCHNASLVVSTDTSESVNIDEFFKYLNKRRCILDGVCITGGEPLLQKDIADFMAKIKELGYAVKLDTNGSKPQLLRELIEGGLVDYVAMDIKGSREKYSEICGIEKGKFADEINESVGILLGGKVDYEFRTTVVRELHQKDDFHDIGKWIAGADKYFLQQFKDSGDILSSDSFSPYGKEEMEEILNIVKEYIPTASLRGV